MSLWKSNFGSTYQNLPRYLKSLTFLFPWIAKAISMHQNVHWSFYSLPAEFFKNSVKMISSRLHLKFHQISNWQWNRKCIFLTIIPLICLFLRLGYVRTARPVNGATEGSTQVACMCASCVLPKKVAFLVWVPNSALIGNDGCYLRASCMLPACFLLHCYCRSRPD